ncbi:polysaccharide biosynthesis C-terminal domain-containing protein [Filimonas lacunae]|nr:oligosaccharide flippase family protein [Filimonas lacunae]BAV07193.1 polysaccharide biosynthesis protein [Filimonas lacunae]
MVGFAIGGINILFIAPKMLTTQELGLTRIFLNLAVTLSTFCTLGSLPVIYKFSPIYRKHLTPEKSDLPFVTLMLCLLGFVILCIGGYLGQELIVRKYSARSPLFVKYSNWIFPFTFFMLLLLWLEAFSWTFKKTVISNAMKELLPRLAFTVLLILMGMHWLSLPVFIGMYAFSYLPAVIILFYTLRKTREFYFNGSLSKVTFRLKGKMATYGLFLFGAQFLNMLSKNSDDIIITANAPRGLTDTAVFAIATYIITLMEVPQRSITAISMPVLAESWRNKDMDNIKHVYHKSVSNLMAIGLAMFALLLLNSHNIMAYLGKDYSGIEFVILVLGLGKLADLCTGANAQIISTSSFWRAEFITNVIYTFLAIPLGYILITHYGLMGAAYAATISLCFFNLMRYFFLWYKYKLQPYTWKHLWVVLVTAGITAVIHFYLPRHSSFIVDGIIRTASFSLVFFPFILTTRLSGEINQMANKQWGNVKRLLGRNR